MKKKNFFVFNHLRDAMDEVSKPASRSMLKGFRVHHR